MSENGLKNGLDSIPNPYGIWEAQIRAEEERLNAIKSYDSSGTLTPSSSQWGSHEDIGEAVRTRFTNPILERRSMSLCEAPRASTAELDDSDDEEVVPGTVSFTAPAPPLRNGFHRSKTTNIYPSPRSTRNIRPPVKTAKKPGASDKSPKPVEHSRSATKDLNPQASTDAAISAKQSSPTCFNYAVKLNIHPGNVGDTESVSKTFAAPSNGMHMEPPSSLKLGNKSDNEVIEHLESSITNKLTIQSRCFSPTIPLIDADDASPSPPIWHASQVLVNHKYIYAGQSIKKAGAAGKVIYGPVERSSRLGGLSQIGSGCTSLKGERAQDSTLSRRSQKLLRNQKDMN